MAVYNLPTNIDSTYADSPSDPSQELHQAYHDAIHRHLNRFNDATPGTVGWVQAWDGTMITSVDPNVLTQSTRTGSYTAVLADRGTVVEFNAGSGVTFTIPANSSVGFVIGTVIGVRQFGAGAVTIVGASGVAVNARGGLASTAGQYAEATLTKRATDGWILSGDLA